ncbi:putative transcription factor GRAS family [Helianthus anomalus]
MLGSSSCSQHHQQQNQELHSQSDLFQPPPPPPAVTGQLSLPLPLQLPLQLHHHQIPPSIHLRQLLLTCAHSISQTDFTTAHRITTILLANSSPSGDSSERLIHSFTKALTLRLRLHPTPPLSINNNESWKQPLTEMQDKDTYVRPNMAQYPLDQAEASCTGFACQNNDEILQSSYFSLNQITPFIRFSHLTANQAILEAIQQQQFSQDIHILDFDIMHGFQWPPLMQAIADRHPPLTLRITATGTNLSHLRRTGDRLSKFAHSLNLTFQFFPLLLPHNHHHHHTVDDVIRHLSAVVHLPNETLAVNCIHYLHRMLTNRDKLCLLLKKIKSMNPKVVTLAENESNHNHPVFISRFKESLHYYTAVFDSLEATLPPNSRERMEVEQVWFGREISDIVAAEGEDRRVRHERFLSWEMIMRLAGFRNVGLSSFNVTQAKLLLRLHYPCEGYNLEVVNDCFFLGWQNQPLFSVSSWH